MSLVSSLTFPPCHLFFLDFFNPAFFLPSSVQRRRFGAGAFPDREAEEAASRAPDGSDVAAAGPVDDDEVAPVVVVVVFGAVDEEEEDEDDCGMFLRNSCARGGGSGAISGARKRSYVACTDAAADEEADGRFSSPREYRMLSRRVGLEGAGAVDKLKLRMKAIRSFTILWKCDEGGTCESGCPVVADEDDDEDDEFVERTVVSFSN